MQINVSMTNFRCFASVGPVRIAPITVLIGENSSGKTSFLAGLRELVEAFTRSTGNAFNREPYFLGSFEQIAHYRGGKAGRAKSFCLEVEPLSGPQSPDLFSQGRRMTRGMTHRLTFSKGETQPELSQYSVAMRDIEASIDLSGARAKITLRPSNAPQITLTTDRTPSSEVIRRDVSFLGYFLQDLARRQVRDTELHTGNDMGADGTVRVLATRMRSTSRMMTREVFASAPVRIQPRRVYTPSEISALNPGEQVPLQIANMKLASADKWEETKAKLVKFGKRAGLFEDIEIKRFGKTNSDPFQLQIKNQGPAANIVDVGYGVSQALPLLFPLQADLGYDFFLLQQPEVHLHPRAQAEFGSLITSLSAANRNANYIIETHSDYILDRIRSDVRDGVINSDDVNILLFRRDGLDTSIRELGVDADGDITNFPDDYRSFFLEEQARVLGL